MTTVKGLYNRLKDDKISLTLASKGGDKTKPVFKMWLKETRPAVMTENHEEKNGHYYECFDSFEGYIKAIDVREKDITIDGRTTTEKRVFLIAKANDVTYEIEVGSYTGRYALRLLERCASSFFDASKPSVISAYHVKDKEGKKKPNIGMMLRQDGNKVELPSKEEADAIGMPQPEIIETDDGEKWVWKKRANWLVETLKSKLIKAWNEELEDLDDLHNLDDYIEKESNNPKPSETSKKVFEEPDDDLPF